MHCTGFLAKIALQEALGEGCVPAGVGIKVEVQGEAADEPFMPIPSWADETPGIEIDRE